MQAKDNSPTAGDRQLAETCLDVVEARAILDSIPDLIWLKDINGIFLDCNPAIERLLGAKKADIIGKTDHDFFDRSLANFFRERDRKAGISDKPICNTEWLTYADNGQHRLHETTKMAMRDTSGKLIGILGVAHDITERTERKINDDEQYRREIATKHVLDNAADAIFIADQQGSYQYVNEQAVQLLGYDRDELLRMRFGDLTASEDMAEALLQFSKLCSTGSLRCELRLRHSNGDNIPVDLNGAILPDGRAYCSCRDIRARKLADAEREQQSETLVREVHHRIKNTLQGVTGLLQRELGKFQELSSRLNVAISQINAIAIVHGLQATHSDEAVSLCTSVRNICHMISELAQRPVALHIDEMQNSFSALLINKNDAISVALVLNELILNALKHSPVGSNAPAVILQATETSIELSIRNAVGGVPDFNFDTGDKLGTGLSLVRSLLPKQGARLNYQFDSLSGCMLTTLHITAPVVLARAIA